MSIEPNGQYFTYWYWVGIPYPEVYFSSLLTILGYFFEVFGGGSCELWVIFPFFKGIRVGGSGSGGFADMFLVLKGDNQDLGAQWFKRWDIPMVLGEAVLYTPCQDFKEWHNFRRFFYNPSDQQQCCTIRGHIAPHHKEASSWDFAGHSSCVSFCCGAPKGGRCLLWMYPKRWGWRRVWCCPRVEERAPTNIEEYCWGRSQCIWVLYNLWIKNPYHYFYMAVSSWREHTVFFFSSCFFAKMNCFGHINWLLLQNVCLEIQE